MVNLFRRGTMLDRALSRGAGVAFITQVSAVGLGYLTHVLLARWMGVTEYGVYVYALAWAAPLAALGGLGVHMVALRFVPAYATSKAYGLIRGSYRAGANVAFTGGLAVSVMALGVLGFIQNDVRPLVFWSLAIAFPLIPLLSLTYFNTNFLKALKRVGWAGLSDVIRPPLLAGGATIILLYAGTVTSERILVVLGGILLLTTILQFLLARRAMPAPARKAQPVTDFPAWKQAITAMLLIEVFQALMTKADVLLLGAMIDVNAVAVFGVAGRVAGLVGFVVTAVSTMAGPMFTELHSEGRQDELRQLVRTAGQWMLWPSLALTAILAISSPIVLGLFGRDFVAGTSVLWILLTAQLVNACVGPVFVLITFTGFHQHSARIFGYMLFLNVILNIIGIRFLGIHGAAVAALATAITWGVLLHRAVSKNLNVTASPLIHAFLHSDRDSHSMES